MRSRPSHSHRPQNGTNHAVDQSATGSRRRSRSSLEFRTCRSPLINSSRKSTAEVERSADTATTDATWRYSRVTSTGVGTPRACSPSRCGVACECGMPSHELHGRPSHSTSPHARAACRSASNAGSRDRPRIVSAYSTRGGASAYAWRVRTRAASRRFSRSASVRVLTGASAATSSVVRIGPRSNAITTCSDHRSPTTPRSCSNAQWPIVLTGAHSTSGTGDCPRRRPEGRDGSV